jgi:endonuclease YncB( thermonuclease family)
MTLASEGAGFRGVAVAMGESDVPIRIHMIRRLRWRWIVLGIAALLLLSSILDHTRVLGYIGNPRQSFGGQRVIVAKVENGDTLIVHRLATDEAIHVHLLGVAAPEANGEYWADRAGQYLQARVLNCTVTLRLDSIGWRDSNGVLQAYVYLTDADDLNLDLIHDGQAYTDRRITHSQHGPFEAAENEARKKKRGLWQSVTAEQMPAWRREWLKSRGY